MKNLFIYMLFAVMLCSCEQSEKSKTDWGITIIPNECDIYQAGQSVVFSGHGGDGLYHWSVQESEHGELNQDEGNQVIYTALVRSSNQLYLSDESGHFAVVYIVPR